MLRVVRPLAVFSVASAVSLAAALQLVIGVGGAHGSDGTSPHYSARSAFGSYEYDLTRLKLLEKVLYHVEESYVEPGRIDWEAMFVEALEAVERQVPSTMFTRDPKGRILSMGINGFNTVLEVDTVDSRRRLLEELRQVASLLQSHLEVEDIPHDDPQVERFASIEYTLINGLLSTLDPHSVLLPPPDASEMDVENQGEFGGLGITITVDNRGRLKIEFPLEDTPAHKAGLQADDRIVRIDGESTINMSLDEAVRLLRGPVGRAVVLEVIRGEARDPVQFDIVRQRIPHNPVKRELLDGDVGYIEIKSFHQQVERDLHDLLAKLHRDTAGGQLQGLVLDLRGNPGGYLTQAVRVADAFLNKGTIVSTVDGSGQRRDEEIATNKSEPLYPIAVLVDASSASASEIVAGALRNNERAVIIGERTFGKGSVQNLHSLVDESKLKITISKYLTPGDRSIQSVGIPADIELRPMVVRKGGQESGPANDLALVYYRERVRREADLDKHLDAESLRVEEPAYIVPFLAETTQRRRRVEYHPSEDVEVRFARDLLLSAPSWRRSEILASAGAVVHRASKKGEQAVEEAFQALGVDWSRGQAWPRDGDGALDAPLSLRLDLGDDEVLTVGQEQKVAVEITNHSSRALHRVAAVATDNEILDGREFFFGKIGPGETRRWEHKITLTDGYPSERMPVTFEIRDSGAGVLARRHTRVPVAGRPLPRLEWSWTVSDTENGDGDGVASIGETLDIALTVRNVGNGPTSDAFARVKNRSGRHLDIVRGTVSPGTMLDADDAPCEPEEPGTEAGTVFGDPAHERVVNGREPLWPSGCRRVLYPGQTWTGTFQVALREEPTDGRFALELVTGDTEAYDYASVVRAGFRGYQYQQEEISFSVGAPLPDGAPRKPPAIHVTRAPALVVEGARATISGVVEDDSGIAHVMVFAADDKVFYQGSGRGNAVRQIPFTADVELAPGANTITVLATDIDGFTHSASVVTYFGNPEVALAGSLDGR